MTLTIGHIFIWNPMFVAPFVHDYYLLYTFTIINFINEAFFLALTLLISRIYVIFWHGSIIPTLLERSYTPNVLLFQVLSNAYLV